MSHPRHGGRLALLALAAGLLLSSCTLAQQSQSPAAACSSCHAVASTLPQGHPLAPGDSIAACATCHPPKAGEVGPNGYSVRLHRAHVKAGADCAICHVWKANESFGLIGGHGSLGTLDAEDLGRVKKATDTWGRSPYLAARHGEKHTLACGSCHLKQLIPDDNEALVNRQCVACHGTGAQVAAKAKSRNPHIDPHKSHLGEIACTACHQGHQASKVYCLGCHTNFVMTIPGGDR